MNMKYSAVSLFSGCGGSDLGLRSAGIESIFANDISPTACHLYGRVVAENVITAKPIQEITKFPKSDILVGCYPCQGYSQGGRRNSNDGLNYLYRDFDRALRSIKPLAFIVENVSGMVRSNNRSLLNNQLVRFRLAGYTVNYAILNAKDYGLPQDRKRLFIVGIRSTEKKRYDFPPPTHGTLAKHPVKTMRESIWKYRNASEGSYNDEPFHWYYLSRNRRRNWDEVSPCIVANWRHTPLHPDSPNLVKVGTDVWKFDGAGTARRFSYLECAALQGFPHPEKFDVTRVVDRFTAIGNAVPPPLFKAVSEKLVESLE